MKKQVVSVKDRAADAFMTPFFVPSRGMAIRSFKDEVNRKDAGNIMSQHPDDFDLYLLAEWSEDSGQFVQVAEGAVLLIRGKDCIEKVN